MASKKFNDPTITNNSSPADTDRIVSFSASDGEIFYINWSQFAQLGANRRHILEFNKNLTLPQDTTVDYTKTLTETLKGVSGVSYESYEVGTDTDWVARADIAAVNAEIGTWSSDGFIRVIVSDVTSTGIDIGFVILEET